MEKENQIPKELQLEQACDKFLELWDLFQESIALRNNYVIGGRTPAHAYMMNYLHEVFTRENPSSPSMRGFDEFCSRTRGKSYMGSSRNKAYLDLNSDIALFFKDVFMWRIRPRSESDDSLIMIHRSRYLPGKKKGAKKKRRKCSTALEGSMPAELARAIPGKLKEHQRKAGEAIRRQDRQNKPVVVPDRRRIFFMLGCALGTRIGIAPFIPIDRSATKDQLQFFREILKETNLKGKADEIADRWTATLAATVSNEDDDGGIDNKDSKEALYNVLRNTMQEIEERALEIANQNEKAWLKLGRLIYELATTAISPGHILTLTNDPVSIRGALKAQSELMNLPPSLKSQVDAYINLSKQVKNPPKDKLRDTANQIGQIICAFLP